MSRGKGDGTSSAKTNPPLGRGEVREVEIVRPPFTPQRLRVFPPMLTWPRARPRARSWSRSMPFPRHRSPKRTCTPASVACRCALATLDQSHRTDAYAAVDDLVNQGGPTKIDAAHAAAHYTMSMIDRETVMKRTCSLHKGRASEQCRALAAHSGSSTRGTGHPELAGIWRRTVRHRSEGGPAVIAAREGKRDMSTGLSMNQRRA